MIRADASPRRQFALTPGDGTPRDAAVVASLTSVIAYSDDAIYSEHLDGTITSWNRGAERLIGHSARAAIGLPADSLYPEHLQAELRSLRRRVQAGEVVEGCELEFARPDATNVPVLVTATPIIDRDGAVVGTWTSARDATEQRTAQATLADSAARLEEAHALAHMGIWAWNAVTDEVELSAELYRICGSDPRAFDGSLASYLATVHEDDRDAVERSIRLAMESASSFAHEYRVVRPDGEIRWVHARGEPAADVDGRSRALRGIAEDVTERRDADEALRRHAGSLELLKRLAIAANQALTLDDALRTSLGEICEHTGWPVGRAYLANLPGDELTLTPVWHVADPRYEAFRDATPTTSFPRGLGIPGRVLATARPASITSLATSDIEPAAAAEGLQAAFAFPVRVGDHAVAVLEFLAADPTPPDTHLLEVMATAGTQLGRVVERSRAASLLSEQATHDALTGLPNRSLFLTRLQEALVEDSMHGTTVAVLFVDLDGFKLVNDSLGHAAGDDVLVKLGKRIRGVLKPSDIVARFGGDEFTILCRGFTDEDDVISVVHRIEDVIARPLTLTVGGEVAITSSIGVVFGRGHVDDAEVLLRDADVAMYRAKRQGRARHEIFNVGMHTEAMQRLTTVNRLRHAVDQGELRVFYQPQYFLDDDRLAGAEALIRWQRPDEGLTLPDEFIQLAEESQLIVPIGAWVLAQACLQSVKWKSAVPFKMAVNVSAYQLARPELVSTIRDTLAATGADASSLCLEITESVLMGDSACYLEAMTGLKDLGVSIAVDDFGMGYSSLAYLQRFPVDILKIDKAFVARLGHGDARGRAVVGAVINLAHALDLTSVAEGVETAEQRQDLIDLGCTIGQGYFFGHPEPVTVPIDWHPHSAATPVPAGQS